MWITKMRMRGRRCIWQLKKEESGTEHVFAILWPPRLLRAGVRACVCPRVPGLQFHHKRHMSKDCD